MESISRTEEFRGRRAIVTGAASGIGRAVADQLQALGATVTFADNDADAAAAAAGEAGGSSGHVDVADERSVLRFFEDYRAVDPRLDLLVNVAGVQRAGSVVEATVDDWDAQMAVNARGTFLMLKHALPLMTGQPGAAVVNIASAGGVRGFAGLSGYSASKAAVIALTKCVAKEVAGDGIRVNALSPGWVDTPFNDPITDQVGGRSELEAWVAREVPLQRQASPPEAAAAVLFLLSGASAYATGHNLVLDGGFTV